VPAWVITSGDARQYERGLVKTGKEAEVYLVERRFGDQVNLLAAKRYRDFDDRMFRNDARYRQGRRTGNRRHDLAVAKGSRAGMAFRAQQWVATEFEALSRLWSAGVPVPYPVQQLGSEILLEFVGDDAEAAPRLAQFRGSVAQYRELFDQFVASVTTMSSMAIVHGDLSPYNMLVWRDQLYFIDFPQAVDPLVNAEGITLLERDVTHICAFFERRGVTTDGGALLATLVAEIFA